MAAAKKKKRRRVMVHTRRRWLGKTPEEIRWRIWNHDLDTMLHHLVQNPAMATVDPKELVARAAAFADALHALQDERRPASVAFDGRY